MQNDECRMMSGRREMPNGAGAERTTGGSNLSIRTKSFALAVVRLVESLPRTRASDVIGKQLLRSGTSVGSNYRAACRARSRAEFVAKIGIVAEEADESLYWMELLVDGGLIPRGGVRALMAEADELVAIAVASRKTARGSK